MGIQFRKLAARRNILAAALATAGATAWAQDKKSGSDKVVYHIDDAAHQATKGLRNIRNHLDVAPTTQIIVVTHADGVDFLMEGAKDAKNPNIDYASLVSALKARGVRFEVCEITLRNRNLKKDQFIMDADFTPSGVVRIGQLQNHEGFAYLKP
ncbi:MAG: DsrE family protein [Burkholderiales bacterium]|uniref:DsrE family protein n=1 Tax=Ottowia pentelensis TaxID=511108 RepID=A0ABV6PQB5_9BURK|nr:DsrE family protein [Burkholderiales bacterium]MBS0401471.1 DsrE family protein [Pseudomonadota bacterium]MBS0413923.1 DsrE family protein [Pseudomonadota bacterium]